MVNFSTDLMVSKKQLALWTLLALPLLLLLLLVTTSIWPKPLKARYHQWSLTTDQHFLMKHWTREGTPIKKSFADRLVYWMQGEPTREELFESCAADRVGLAETGFVQTKTFTITNGLATTEGFQSFCTDAMNAFSKNVFWSIQDWQPAKGTVSVTDRPQNFPVWQQMFDKGNQPKK